jgi:hypothetical protein
MPTISSLKIQEIQKRLKERSKKQQSFKGTVDKNFFPFWNMEAGEEAVVRIIPDSNPDNPLPYYIESFNHKLIIDGRERTVICPKTFDSTTDCPICERSQKYYRENNKEKGSYYWRNRNNLVRVLVLKSPLTVKDENGDTVEYEGRVCTSNFGSQVLEAFENQMSQMEEDDNAPWMFKDGFNFHIKKTTQGEHYNYAFSYFDKKPSSLPDEFINNIELIDYKDLLPDKPHIEKVQHYLDAHDGAVEFNPKYSSDEDSKDVESSNDNTVVIPHIDESVTVENSKVIIDDSDEDDFIKNILSRK